MAGAHDKRGRLVEAAGRLTHRQGFNRTSLAQIADQAEVPLGNVYYYFKTKEAIGQALVERYRCGQAALRQQWDSHPDPRSRIEAFIDMTVQGRDLLARHGCAIGTLNSELHKSDQHEGPLSQKAARLFADLLAWLEAQFRALTQDEEPRDLAVHLLSALQGASLLAHTFGDPDYVVREAHRLKQWIHSLSTP